MKPEKRTEYWKRHTRLLMILVAIWFFISFCLPLFLVDQLNAIRIGGYQLGFWFMAQGSIILLIVLLFVYSFLMGRLDSEFENDQA